MNPETYRSYGISSEAIDLGLKAEELNKEIYKSIDDIKEFNQLKVLKAFSDARFSEAHFSNTTGYGYDDIGRDKIEEIFASIFGADKAYVRIQISSGTQAISAMLYGILRPNEKLLSITGRPYDTLASTIGFNKDEYDGSLMSYGILYDEIEMTEDEEIDYSLLKEKLDSDSSIKVVFLQKSRGYSSRRALTSCDIEKVATLVHSYDRDIIFAVDNCYGEFTERREPTEVGADICAGSLIKNPGGGIAPSGGYICGREDLVERTSRHITAPGLGSHVGPTLGFNRLLAQGIFMAPHVVAECLKGAIFASRVFELQGLQASPSATALRGDIVQTITFGDKEKLVKFCSKIQNSSPIDSFVSPEPWDMPGYEDQVVMAAGTFVQGATTELSCDGPIRPPFIAYMQGGLVREQVKLSVLRSLS